MRTDLLLNDIILDFDVRCGKVWIFGRDDELCYIKVSEIQQTIDFLSDFIKEK